eukprot:5981238-Alexandrium_andersonii.AAC.1
MLILNPREMLGAIATRSFKQTNRARHTRSAIDATCDDGVARDAKTMRRQPAQVWLLTKGPYPQVTVALNSVKADAF